MKNNKRILCTPAIGFVIVVTICVLGIITDFATGQVLFHNQGNERIGIAFSVFGSYLSYCLYPAVGVCLYLGERRSNEILANILLPTSFVIAILFAKRLHGAKVEFVLSNYTSLPIEWWPVTQWLFWMTLFSWVPFVCFKLFDDYDSNKLCFTGVTILGVGLVSEAVTVWSRIIPPTLFSEFRGINILSILNPFVMLSSWGRMLEYSLQNYDPADYWPNGNMTAATLTLSLPLLTDVIKERSDNKNTLAFTVALFFVVMYGLNRVQITERSLSDVCIDALVTYLLLVVCGLVAFYPIRHDGEQEETKK